MGEPQFDAGLSHLLLRNTAIVLDIFLLKHRHENTGYWSCGLHEPTLGYTRQHRWRMGFYYTELLGQVWLRSTLNAYGFLRISVFGYN